MQYTNTTTMDIIEYEGKRYGVSVHPPKNGDLVLTDNHGVWTFKDETGNGSAPIPYWANRNTCKRLVELDENGRPLVHFLSPEWIALANSLVGK